LYCDGRPGAVTVSFVHSVAKGRESYLFDGSVEFVMGCLLAHALAVVVAEDAKADEDTEIVFTEDLIEDGDAVVASKEVSDEDEDISDAAELEIGDTVR
jgi:hypothetical protein